mmetsp:Transcript_11018/g.20747  ORF Transcript_11018/g.20747 Transcript_11018/m.20747 type:complete len:305 (-) Transcript_11018:70-984(-)
MAVRQQLIQVAEKAPLEKVQELLMFATELGIPSLDERESTKPEEPVRIRVLYPSGGVAFDDHLPSSTPVASLLQILQGKGHPAGRLALLHGTNRLSPREELGNLTMTEDDCLYLLRRAAGVYTQLVGETDGNHKHLAKCIILGGAKVGKTSLLRAVTKQPFQEMYNPTIGVDFHISHFESDDGTKFKVQMWDTAGQPRFRTITLSYLEGASGFLFVFSLASRTSLTEAVDAFRIAEKRNSAACRTMCLIGTHADAADLEVSEEEATQVASEMEAPYFAVSCSDGGDVQSVLFAWLDAFQASLPV